MGATNFNYIDTTPGSGHWAAPPSPVSNYTEWLRTQYQSDCGVSQSLIVLARSVTRHRLDVTYVGPYADEVKRAVTRIAAGAGR